MAYREIKLTTGYKFPTAERFFFENEGDTLEGHIMEAIKIKTKEGDEMMKYTFKTGDQEFKSFLGCFQLDNTLPGIPLGTLVKVIYNGMKAQKGKKKSVRDFHISADDEKVIPVA